MIKLLRFSDYEKKLWKNGRGTTVEIALCPAGGEFDWRLSMADLNESGPFSFFPGMERILVLLEGAAIKITHQAEASEKNLPLLEPYRFCGEWKTEAIVKEQGRDFNLIYRRDKFVGEVLVESYTQPHQRMIEDKGVSAIFCLEGKILTELGELRRYDTLLVDHQAVRIETSGQTRLINVQLRSIHHTTPREF